MSLALDDNPAGYQIRGYKPGLIKINETTLTHSIIIAPNKLIEPWRPQKIAELARNDLDCIIEMQPAILLIGTGSTLEFPALSVYGHLLNLGIGVEIMDTSAACRTYTALTAENRNVVAALIIQ